MMEDGIVHKQDFTGEPLENVEPIVTNPDDNDDINGEDRKATGICQVLKKNGLLILVCCGVILGFVVGFGLRSVSLTPTTLMLIGLPGEIFMRSIWFTVLPLLVSSIISGTAGMNPKSNGKITLVAFLYFLIVNTTGVTIGVVMFYAISPATLITKDTDIVKRIDKSTHLQTADIFADMIRNLFPDNMVRACFQKTQTFYEEVGEVKNLSSAVDFQRRVGVAPGTNLIGIILVCVFFGITTAKLGEAGRPIVLLFKAISDAMILLMSWVVWLTPAGVLSMIATSISQIKNIKSTMQGFGMFTLSVILSLMILLICFYTAYFVIFRNNPLRFLYTTIRPMMAGFGPPSSALAIPDMLYTVEQQHGVDSRISRFCILMGAAISRTGSAAFVVICSLFLAELENVTLGFGQVLSVSILSVVAAFAMPAIPSSSIICVIIILSSVNVTSTNIGIVMALEWLLDRMRTVDNVLANILGTLLVDKVCSRDEM